MLYHVTKRENCEDIWNKGLKSINKDRPKRMKLRQRIDSIGNDMYDNWVERNNAIFGWPHYERAITYSDRFLEPIIVEYQTNNTTWCVENHMLEYLFANFPEISDADISYFVENCRKWSGEVDEDLEVWTEPPVEVYEIRDLEGNLIEIN